MNQPTALTILHDDVVACRRCPRLVEYRERVGREKRRAYLDCAYWARPVPGFGDPSARVLALGLAPGAHGSNRTGRPFTGDASGNFMYPILHRLGFASQPTAAALHDGLQLHDLWITAAVRCAPPDNKPLPSELANCAAFTRRELDALPNLKVVVALGKFAFDAYLDLAPEGLRKSAKAPAAGSAALPDAPPLRKSSKAPAAGSAALPDAPPLRKSSYPFAHAAEYRLPNGITLLASYHPSNQNTATGKLTVPMFEAVFARARQLAMA
jgi:uracil-DNA glycosylase family 4